MAEKPTLTPMKNLIKKNIEMTTTGLRERKKQKLREELIEVAYQLFVEKGFDETRVEDIANLANVSSRTFFRYFSCKEEVVLEYQAVEHDEILAAFSVRPQDEPVLTALRHASVEVTRGCEDGAYGIDPARFKTIRNLIRNHPLIRAKSIEGSQSRKDSLIHSVAKRMGVEPLIDIRPTIIASVLELAYSATYDIWKDRRTDEHYADILNEVFLSIENNFNDS